MDTFRKRVKVNIFDWGRSEFNTTEMHHKLTLAEQEDRAKYWAMYTGGIDRLAWETMRAYWHVFCNGVGWTKVRATIYDFDTLSANDYIGFVDLNLKATPEVTVPVFSQKGKCLQTTAGNTSFTYEIYDFRKYPSTSRLVGEYRIRIGRCNNLPTLPFCPDAFVTLTATSPCGHYFYKQACVKKNELNPRWDETFAIPVAPQDGGLCASLLEEAIGPVTDWSLDLLKRMTPLNNAQKEVVKEDVAEWRGKIDSIAQQCKLPALSTGVPKRNGPGEATAAGVGFIGHLRGKMGSTFWP